MANHDYVIANQGFPSFRSDLNNVLQAVVSNNSSASEPSTKYAYQMWYETDTNIWFMRNADNDAWIPLATFNQTNNTVNFTDSSSTVAGISTSASATVITLSNGVVALNPAGYVSVGGAATQSGEIRFLEDTDNGANYIAVKSPTANAAGANFTLTLPEATDTLVGKATTDTLTNKTLTSPVISTIVSVSNGDVELAPNGTGHVTVKGNNNPGSIQLNCENNSHGIKLTSPPHSANQSYELKFPTGNVTADKFLKVASVSGSGTTGIGQLSFADAAGGGGVNWDTTIKTGNFTAVKGVGYFCNTTSSAFTATLPSSPSAGDVVAFKDYANTWDSNALTLGRNSQPIGGENINATLSREGLAVALFYIDSTKGWLVTDSGLQSDAGQEQYIIATGGTISTVDTNYKVHTFTGPGTFTVCSVGNACGSNSVDYVVVAGGGGANQQYAGGGGAGGFREGYTPGAYSASPLAGSTLPVSATGYPITVGAGSGGVPAPSGRGINGSNSTFSSITSAGGGGGGAGSTPAPSSDGPGLPGGSGGGAGSRGGSNTGGTGNTPPVSPAQGKNGGGASSGGSGYASGGGGGASAVGSTPTATTDNTSGQGGNGVATSITGSAVTRAGGGGGNVYAPSLPTTSLNAGGSGGGGDGSRNGPTPIPNAQHNGTANTGGGAGAGGTNTGGYTGGSGVVIIRYKFQ